MTPKKIVLQFLIGTVAGALFVLALGGVYYLLSNNQSLTGVKPDSGFSSDVALEYNTSSARDPLPPMSEMLAALEDLTQFQQVGQLYETFKNASALDLRRAFAEAQSEASSFLQDEVEVAIVQRLASLDPQGGLKLIDGTNARKRGLLLQEMFGELSNLDFESAVSLALENDSPADRQVIFRGIFQARDDLPTQVLLQTAGRLGVEREALDLIAASQAEHAMHGPFGSWETFLSVHGSDIDELSSVQFNLLTSIAQRWIDQAGTRAMQEIFSSLRNVEGRIQVFSRLLNNASQEDAQLTQSIIKWLNLTDRSVLIQSFAEWGASAPQSALELIQSMNLGVAQQAIERAAIESLSRNDPIAVLENLDDVTEDLRIMAERDALRAMTRTTPESVPSWLEGISDEDTKEIAIDSLVDNWAQQDPRSALDWIVADDSPIGPHRRKYLAVVLPNLVEDEPQLALRIALEQPVGDSEIGLEALVMGGMATVDSDMAVSKLSSARNQTTREAALVAIGKSLVEKGDADRAIELAEDLPRQQQISYYSGLSTAWALANPEDLLQNLDRLPSRDIQQMLVRDTLQFDRIVGALSPEQRTALNDFLSDQKE